MDGHAYGLASGRQFGGGRSALIDRALESPCFKSKPSSHPDGANVLGRAGRWYFLGTLAGVACFLLIGNAQHLSSIGFQCSFVATAALGLAMPQLRWRPYDDWPRRMARLVLVMCAPWLAVLPLGAYHFGVIHPYGAVLTLIASPVLSLILPIVWTSVFLGLYFPQLASMVGSVVVPALMALQWVLESLSALPWVQIRTNFFDPMRRPPRH